MNKTEGLMNCMLSFGTFSIKCTSGKFKQVCQRNISVDELHYTVNTNNQVVRVEYVNAKLQSKSSVTTYTCIWTLLIKTLQRLSRLPHVRKKTRKIFISLVRENSANLVQVHVFDQGDVLFKVREKSGICFKVAVNFNIECCWL